MAVDSVIAEEAEADEEAGERSGDERDLQGLAEQHEQSDVESLANAQVGERGASRPVGEERCERLGRRVRQVLVDVVPVGEGVDAPDRPGTRLRANAAPSAKNVKMTMR